VQRVPERTAAVIVASPPWTMRRGPESPTPALAELANASTRIAAARVRRRTNEAADTSLLDSRLGAPAAPSIE
jgi:hypothetical protein